MHTKKELSLNALQEKLPDLMKAFRELHDVAKKQGALSSEVKELMFIAISVALRCEPCIRKHTKTALEMGISHEEILEAAGVAIVMAGGPSVAYTSILLEVLDEEDEPVTQV